MCVLCFARLYCCVSVCVGMIGNGMIWVVSFCVGVWCVVVLGCLWFVLRMFDVDLI